MEPTPVGRSRQYRTPVRGQQPAHRRPNGRRAVPSPVRRVLDALRDAERATRPEDPEVAAAHAARWEELPAGVRTASQLLGRKFTGCEGTHGVFPACNLGCEPCYHGKDANRVPVDGVHTVAEVERQMAYLRERRGPGQYAQLIGGEVSLLPPDAHAEALATMRRHGRIPMSFTYGDFDQDHLEAVVLAPDGTPRFDAVAFAVHIDSTMRGRRVANQPRNEAELHDERARVAAMFEQLQQRYGIRSYLAHNMTVTPDNVDEIPEVVQVCRELGYRMCSFQPAAYVGDQRRWDEGYRELTDELVWSRIEAGTPRSSTTVTGGTYPHAMLARWRGGSRGSSGGWRPARPPRVCAAVDRSWRRRTSCTASWALTTSTARGSCWSVASLRTIRPSGRPRSDSVPVPTTWPTRSPTGSSRRACSTACSIRRRTSN